MGEDAFSVGLTIGLFISFVVFLAVWHIGESECQKKRNVYDCVLTEEHFIPKPIGENDGTKSNFYTRINAP